MRSTQKILLGLVAIVLIACIIGYLIGSMGGGTSHTVPPVTENASPQAAPAPGPEHAPAVIQDHPVVSAPVPQSPVTHALPAPVPAPAVPETPGTNWEGALDDILASDSDDTNKVKQLLEMFPNLPEDGQVEVAEHLVNLSAGQDLTPLAQILQNPKLPEAVQDVILGDALNWPNQPKLTTLLEVARNPEHPKAAEAKDWLELYIGEDYGTNWGQWQEKTQEFLKNNPE